MMIAQSSIESCYEYEPFCNMATGLIPFGCFGYFLPYLLHHQISANLFIDSHCFIFSPLCFRFNLKVLMQKHNPPCTSTVWFFLFRCFWHSLPYLLLLQISANPLVDPHCFWLSSKILKLIPLLNLNLPISLSKSC